MISGSLVETWRDGQTSLVVVSLLVSIFPAVLVSRKKKDINHYCSQIAALVFIVMCWNAFQFQNLKYFLIIYVSPKQHENIKMLWGVLCFILVCLRNFVFAFCLFDKFCSLHLFISLLFLLLFSEDLSFYIDSLKMHLCQGRCCLLW